MRLTNGTKSKSRVWGKSFLSVWKSARNIGRSPEEFQLVAKDARRAIVGQFPYVIFYRVEAKATYVYSVFHASQNPQKWMERVGEWGKQRIKRPRR
jgi:hypothetical protein